METFSTRLLRFREQRGLSQDAAGELLGVTGKYVGMLERDQKQVADDSTIARLLALYEARPESLPALPSSGMREDEVPYKLGGASAITVRSVPILSWAHAGEATAYEEIPMTWQQQTWTQCRDQKAFGLIVEGDSMTPHCLSGDIVVLSPTEEPRNGQLVVAKLTDDGILLRRFARVGKLIRLSAYNPVYPPADYEPDAFHWIYPVHSLNRMNP